MNTRNNYASSLSINRNLGKAIDDAAKQLLADATAPIDLLVAMAAGYSTNELDEHLPRISSLVSAKHIVGTTCESVISGSLELEAEAAVTFWAASFATTQVETMHLKFERGPDGGAFTGWPDSVEADWPDGCCGILFGEPFGFPVDGLIERMNEDRPGLPILGGMASGASTPGEARLLWNDSAIKDGAIFVRLCPDSVVEPSDESNVASPPFEMIVSQGCRPIGEKMIITAAEQNVIKTLGGMPALEQLKKLFATLPTQEQRNIQSALCIGRVIDEYQDKFEYGDFLIRNVIGFDPENNWISIGDFVRPGQTVQFHIRDPQAASVELEQLLKKRTMKDPAAALLFTCNGRGSHMFPEPHHDAALIRGQLGEIPLAGYFAAGEIGPVAGKNFLHGYTASIILFE